MAWYTHLGNVYYFLLKIILIYFQNTVPQRDITLFEVKGIGVYLQNSEITHISTTAKEKNSLETQHEKQTRILESDKNYRKRKRAMQSEMTRKQDKKKTKSTREKN